MNFMEFFFIFQQWPMSINNAYHCAYIHITVSPIWQSAILMLLERKEPSWNTRASWSIPGMGGPLRNWKDDDFPGKYEWIKRQDVFFFCGAFKLIFQNFGVFPLKTGVFLFWFKEDDLAIFQRWMADEIIQTLLCLDLLSNHDRRLSLAYSTQSDALAGCQELLHFQFYVIMWATYSSFLVVQESFLKRSLVATLGSILSSM